MNLVVVIALAAMGAVFLTGRPRLVRYAVWFGMVFCLADWVLVEDFGFLGGLGTDPNSMIPWILLFFGGLPRPDAGAAGEHGRRGRGLGHGPGLAATCVRRPGGGQR